MRPEIQWTLWIKDSERFCWNPLKEEVKVAAVALGFATVFLVIFVQILLRATP